jgi:hypothetical protein
MGDRIANTTPTPPPPPPTTTTTTTFSKKDWCFNKMYFWRLILRKRKNKVMIMSLK